MSRGPSVGLGVALCVSDGRALSIWFWWELLLHVHEGWGICKASIGCSGFGAVLSGSGSDLLEAETSRVCSSNEIWVQNEGDPYIGVHWSISLDSALNVGQSRSQLGCPLAPQGTQKRPGLLQSFVQCCSPQLPHWSWGERQDSAK